MTDDYENSKFINAVNEYIHNQRDRDILIDRFFIGLSISELSAKYTLCERQIQRIIQKADKLLVHI